MPSGWSGDWVRMLRTIASRSAIAAIFGRYSHTGMPVTFDGCGRNGPAVGRPGFMSNVSIWLAPPLAHRRMQRLPRFAASAAAVRAWNSPPQLATAPPAVTKAPLRNARRARCGFVTRGDIERLRRCVSRIPVPGYCDVHPLAPLPEAGRGEEDTVQWLNR